MSRIVLPGQGVAVDADRGVDPIWYERFQQLTAFANLFSEVNFTTMTSGQVLIWTPRLGNSYPEPTEMAGFFDTLFGGGAEKEAADKDRALYQQYQQQGTGFLKDAYGQGRTDLGQAVSAFSPLAALGQQYNQAGTLNLDALGVNGPEGNARATQAFQVGPGYQFAVDQGMDALNRRRAAGGMLNSGNADVDAIRFGQGTANQEYGNWLQRLQGAGQMGLNATTGAATGQAAGYSGLANLANQYGQNQTNLLGNTTSGQANANNLQAAGEAAGAKNLLGFGTQVASMALGIPGGGGGGTALGGGGGYNFYNSPLGSLFKPS